MFKFLKDRKKKDNKGFTLVELVIVIAILAILVGLLAPQYTKYVEKSRKAAHASNMDEMVKVVKVYAADPANELPAGTYKIVINNDKSKGTEITAVALVNSSIAAPSKEAVDKLVYFIIICKTDDLSDEDFPIFFNLKLLGSKWIGTVTICDEFQGFARELLKLIKCHAHGKDTGTYIPGG